jgi:hypothetical protein
MGMNRDYLAAILGRYGKGAGGGESKPKGKQKVRPEGKRGGRPPKYRGEFKKVVAAILRSQADLRKTAGYFRFDTPGECAALAEVYRFLCPLYNYWNPSFKLVPKGKQAGGGYRKT